MSRDASNRAAPGCAVAATLLALSLTNAVVAQRPDDRLPTDLSAAALKQRRQHWAWQSLAGAIQPPNADATLPAVTHPVDAFIRAHLEAADLDLSPEAEPETLLRRLWFDLVGLPPPPEVVLRFLAEPGEAAYRAEVERLLASPHFGERQARHWLDLVRYSETLGHEFDYELPNAWRYRDYVIRACNADLPYDQFVREHLAGDLLATPRRDADGNNESVVATGAFWLLEQAHSPLDVLQHEADRLDNQLDTLGKAVLGLTIGCARCHDHKFDAITAGDYYGLLSYVQGSRYVQAPIRPWPADSESFIAAKQAQLTLAAAAGCDAPPLPPGVSLRPDDRVIASAEAPELGWFLTNDAFGDQPLRGTCCVAPPSADADTPVLLHRWPGPFWCSAVAGARREGTLHTRTFTIDDRWLHVRAAGRHSRIKVIVDGFYLIRDPIYGDLHRGLDAATPTWLTFDLSAFAGHRAFVMAIDQRDPDLADPKYDRNHYPEHAWLALQSVVLSPHAEPPPTAASPAPLQLDRQQPEIASALEQLWQCQQVFPVSPTVPTLADGTAHDGFIYLRGSPHRRGAPAPRQFLTALRGEAAALPASSGNSRLELAEAVLAADNPLPARVAVNRIWHHLFGRGLVKSVDNLGALGDRPTHPALLDWLALQLQQHQWSQKHVLRLLVTSATYRQQSRRSERGEQLDPDNLLLHRQNVRPLEGEVLRDALLAIADRLDPAMYGPPIEQPRERIGTARGAPRSYGPENGAGRRSIYLAVRRNFPTAMLQAFDQPTPFACVGARNRSNVPAQALTLANDAFVRQRCVELAQQVGAAAAALDARLDALYLRCFARRPSAAERQRCREFLAAPDHDNDDGDNDAAVLADLVHTLVSTTEFRFLR